MLSRLGNGRLDREIADNLVLGALCNYVGKVFTKLNVNKLAKAVANAAAYTPGMMCRVYSDHCLRVSESVGHLMNQFHIAQLMFGKRAWQFEVNRSRECGIGIHCQAVVNKRWGAKDPEAARLARHAGWRQHVVRV